ncbi:MAG: HD-GYP domain-containing protein, partial [Limnobacter sp.]
MSVEKPADDQQLIKDLERQLADFQGIADKLGKEVETLQGANSSLNQQLESQRAETHQMQMMLEQIQREMRMQYLAAVKSFSNLMELRSPQLAAHGLRVAELARLIAKEMHASDSALQDIYVASLLHDIGKLGLSDDTLFKPVVELKG